MRSSFNIFLEIQLYCIAKVSGYNIGMHSDGEFGICFGNGYLVAAHLKG